MRLCDANLLYFSGALVNDVIWLEISGVCVSLPCCGFARTCINRFIFLARPLLGFKGDYSIRRGGRIKAEKDLSEIYILDKTEKSLLISLGHTPTIVRMEKSILLEW